MITPQYNRAGKFTRCDGLVHCLCYFTTSHVVRIQDARLTANDQVVVSGLFDPSDVVVDLLNDVVVGVVFHALEH